MPCQNNSRWLQALAVMAHILALVSSSKVTIMNHCSYPLYYWVVRSEVATPDSDHITVAPGDTAIHPMEIDHRGISLKIRDVPRYAKGPAGIIQVEYTNVGHGNTFYDLSVIDCNRLPDNANPDYCPFIAGGVSMYTNGHETKNLCQSAQCQIPGSCDERTYKEHGYWKDEPSFHCPHVHDLFFETCTEGPGLQSLDGQTSPPPYESPAPHEPPAVVPPPPSHVQSVRVSPSPQSEPEEEEWSPQPEYKEEELSPQPKYEEEESSPQVEPEEEESSHQFEPEEEESSPQPELEEEESSPQLESEEKESSPQSEPVVEEMPPQSVSSSVAPVSSPTAQSQPEQEVAAPSQTSPFPQGPYASSHPRFFGVPPSRIHRIPMSMKWQTKYQGAQAPRATDTPEAFNRPQEPNGLAFKAQSSRARPSSFGNVKSHSFLYAATPKPSSVVSASASSPSPSPSQSASTEDRHHLEYYLSPKFHDVPLSSLLPTLSTHHPALASFLSNPRDEPGLHVTDLIYFSIAEQGDEEVQNDHYEALSDQPDLYSWSPSEERMAVHNASLALQEDVKAWQELAWNYTLWCRKQYPEVCTTFDNGYWNTDYYGPAPGCPCGDIAIAYTGRGELEYHPLPKIPMPRVPWSFMPGIPLWMNMQFYTLYLSMRRGDQKWKDGAAEYVEYCLREHGDTCRVFENGFWMGSPECGCDDVPPPWRGDGFLIEIEAFDGD